MKIFFTGKHVFLNGEKLKRKYSTYSTRKIFYNDLYVVKIEEEKDRDYYSQCKNEYFLWKKIEPAERKFFIPTLFYKSVKGWDAVVQPRTKIIHKKVYDEKHWKKIERLADKYGLDDLYCDITSNWGFVGKQPIIYDYGV